MDDQQTRVIGRHELPKRPFLHGMASAFDMFGVLHQDRSEQLLANLNEEFGLANRDIVRTAWRRVGKTLYLTMKQHDLLSSGNRR